MSLIERWAYANRLSRRHPAEKAALAGGMLVLSLALPPVPGAALVFALMAAATVGAAGVSVRDYLRVLAVPAGFLLGGAAAMAVSLSAGPDGWRLAASPEGAAGAGPVLLRSLAAVSCLCFLALTTPVVEWAAPLTRRPRVGAAADLALLVYRFLHVLSATLRAMRLAQEARLGYATWGRAHRSLALLFAALLPRALDRALRLERGLAARGYRGELPVLPAERSFSAAALLAVLALELAVAALGVRLGGGWAWPA